MPSRRVLYISYDGLTDPLGQSQVIPYLIGLASAGYSITICSAEKTERFRTLRESTEKLLMENGINWYPKKYSNQIPVISPYVTYRKLRTKVFQLQRAKAFEIVHCRSYIPSLVGLELKRNFGVKFLFDMRGFWADERSEGGIWNLNNPLYQSIYRYFKKKERKFLLESDAIVSLTENAKREIHSWRGLNIHLNKINVIPCCVDLDLFSEKKIDQVKKNILREKLNISKENFVISYAGSIGTWYLLEEMLKFFMHLQYRKPNALFLIITPDDGEKIYALAASLQVDLNKIIVQHAVRDEMPLLLSLSDASVFFIKNTWSKKASSPTKMAELMSMGIPIVCNSDIGDIDEIINKFQAGILIDKLDKEHFDEAVNKLLNTPFSKENIRAAASAFFSLKSGVNGYREIYDSITA